MIRKTYGSVGFYRCLTYVRLWRRGQSNWVR